MGNIILIGVIVLLILLLLFEQEIRESRFYRQMSEWIRKDFWALPPSESLFQIAWDTFLFTATVMVTLYISNATGLVNMTTLWIMLVGFFIIALITTLRIKLQPKNKDDELINSIKQAVKDGIKEAMEDIRQSNSERSVSNIDKGRERKLQ